MTLRALLERMMPLPRHVETVAPVAEVDVGVNLNVQQEDPQLDEPSEGLNKRMKRMTRDSGGGMNLQTRTPEREKEKRRKRKKKEVPKEPDGNTINCCRRLSRLLHPTHTASLPPYVISFT